MENIPQCLDGLILLSKHSKSHKRMSLLTVTELQ